MRTRRHRPGRLMGVLRSPLLVPGGWLVGTTAGALLVSMPRARGPLGVVGAVASLVLGAVLVVSVLVVAVALAAPAVARLAGWVVAVARLRAAGCRERAS